MLLQPEAALSPDVRPLAIDLPVQLFVQNEAESRNFAEVSYVAVPGKAGEKSGEMSYT